MAVLRDTEGSVARARLDEVWPDDVQRDRALASLLADGLVVETETGATPSPADRPWTSRGGRRSDHLG